MAREISMLKDYVIKLEFKVKIQEHQNLETRLTENNVVINCIEEESIEGSNTEALAKTLKAALMMELEMRCVHQSVCISTVKYIMI